jgi:hypothetical protein
MRLIGTAIFITAIRLTAQIDDGELVGNVLGQVVDANSGKGIRNAKVMLSGTGLTTLTDANGRFLITHVPTPFAGRDYVIAVSSPGYAPQISDKVTVLPGAVMALECRFALGRSSLQAPNVRFSYSHERSLRIPNLRRRVASGAIFATREGLAGRTTANGHVIRAGDRFAALPSSRVLSRNGGREFTVRVRYKGRSATIPVWDVGPWNTRDDYWNAAATRETFRQLPRGMPQAQAAFLKGHNGGKDGFGRKVLNPAGIDLADGVFRNDLRMNDNDWVSVEYLWDSSIISSRRPEPGRAPAPTTRRRPSRIPDLAEIIAITEIVLGR